MHDLLASSFSPVSRPWESETWPYRHGLESRVVYPFDVSFLDENRQVPWWKGPEVADKVDGASENCRDQPLPWENFDAGSGADPIAISSLHDMWKFVLHSKIRDQRYIEVLGINIARWVYDSDLLNSILWNYHSTLMLQLMLRCSFSCNASHATCHAKRQKI